jgi:hypothetical protein
MNALHSETCCLPATKRDAAHQAHCSVQALERAFPKVAVLGHSGRNQGVGKLHQEGTHAGELEEQFPVYLPEAACRREQTIKISFSVHD